MSQTMFSHLFANIALAGTLLLSSAVQSAGSDLTAGAGFDLTVDARQNCLELTSRSLNSAERQVCCESHTSRREVLY
jgi:hypothetical protein